MQYEAVYILRNLGLFFLLWYLPSLFVSLSKPLTDEENSPLANTVHVYTMYHRELVYVTREKLCPKNAQLRLKMIHRSYKAQTEGTTGRVRSSKRWIKWRPATVSLKPRPYFATAFPAVELVATLSWEPIVQILRYTITYPGCSVRNGRLMSNPSKFVRKFPCENCSRGFLDAHEPLSTHEEKSSWLFARKSMLCHFFFAEILIWQFTRYLRSTGLQKRPVLPITSAIESCCIIPPM